MTYLNCDGASIHMDFFIKEISPNGGPVTAAEAIVNILVHQG